MADVDESSLAACSSAARVVCDLLEELLQGGAPPDAGSPGAEALHLAWQALGGDDTALRNLGIRCCVMIYARVRRSWEADRALLLAQILSARPPATH